jgi:hypothetical protein
MYQRRDGVAVGPLRFGESIDAALWDLVLDPRQEL